MKLPIVVYGHHILREKCNEVQMSDGHLDNLIDNMWETMNIADGCGLAAPQIGKSIRLFIVDSQTTFETMQPEERPCYFNNNDKGIKETFINARIISYSDETWEDEEGCLSIPGLWQNVKRPWDITVEYFNRSFIRQRKTFSGYTARVIQHEYDHTEGILFIDRIAKISRKLIDRKLKKISKDSGRYKLVK
jgi:peptide deformylase